MALSQVSGSSNPAVPDEIHSLADLLPPELIQPAFSPTGYPHVPVNQL